MGTLFPDSEEYPDHRTLRSPVDAVKAAGPAVAMIVFGIAIGEGPTDLVKADTRLVGGAALERLSTGTANFTPLVGLDGQPIFPQAFTAAEFDALKRP